MNHKKDLLRSLWVGFRNFRVAVLGLRDSRFGFWGSAFFSGLACHPELLNPV